MRKLFTVKKTLFNGFDLIGDKGGTRTFETELEAVVARDTLNIQMIVDLCSAFVCKYGGKLNYYFTGQNLMNARTAKESLQTFVTNCHILKRTGKASALFVWYHMDEYALGNIGYLNHTRQPYGNDYGEMLAIMNEFAVMYAPPLFEPENEFKNTPAVREFYNV